MIELKQNKNSNYVLLPLILWLAAVLFVYWQTFATLHIKWSKLDEPYSHGYLVIFLALYLAWLRAPKLEKIPRNISTVFGPAVIFLAAILWTAGYISFTEILQQLALPILLFGGVLAFYGVHVARLFLVPIGFTYFSIPLWDVLIYPLRVITTEVTSWWLGLYGIPAFIDGFRIQLPAGIVEVAGGCSGLNYLMVGILVGFCYSEIILNTKHRIVSLFMAVGLSVIANWVRVISLVLVAHATEMSHPLITQSHIGFGWVIYAGAMLLYFVFMHFLFQKVLDGNRSQLVSSLDAEGVAKSSVPATGLVSISLVTVLAVLVAAALPVYSVHLQSSSRQQPTPELVYSGARQLIEVNNPMWLPRFKGYDRSQQWRVGLGEGELMVTALTYGEQRQGKELIHYRNKLAREGYEKALQKLDLPGGVTMGVSVVRRAGKARNMLSLWVYRVGDSYTASPLMAKLLQTIAFFTGQPASYIVVSIECVSGCSADEVADRLAKSVAEVDALLEYLNYQ